MTAFADGYDAARSIYALLPKWYLIDDTCATPEYRGRIGTMPQFCVPPNYTLTPDEAAHEAGHLYLDLIAIAHPDALAAYWEWRGFPGTWQDALAASQSKTGNEAWQLDPRESWAECFARSVVTTHAEKTQNWGKDIDPLAARAYFLSLAPTPQTEAPQVRTMYDSITAADIPPSAEMVAGYVDGRYRWTADDWARFPDAVKVRIAAFASTDDGVVGDVELGDMTPSESVDWVRARRAAGVDPTLYVNLGNVDVVRAAFRAAGEPLPHLWLAHYDNDPTIPDGFVAKQYANSTLAGGHYDLSAVVPHWPGVDEGVDMTPDEVIALIEQKYDLTNTIAALKENDGAVADKLRQAAAALGK